MSYNSLQYHHLTALSEVWKARFHLGPFTLSLSHSTQATQLPCYSRDTSRHTLPWAFSLLSSSWKTSPSDIQMANIFAFFLKAMWNEWQGLLWKDSKWTFPHGCPTGMSNKDIIISFHPKVALAHVVLISGSSSLPYFTPFDLTLLMCNRLLCTLPLEYVSKPFSSPNFATFP